MAISHLYPTQRPALDLNFARQKRLDSRVTFTRGSTATYFGSDGLIKTAASGEARFDHDPVTGESLGLLVEESRTNLMTNSEIFTAYSNLTVTSDTATAPDGNTTADKLVPNTTNASHVSRKSATTANTNPHTFSVYAKAAGYNFFHIRFSTNTTVGGPIVDLTTGEKTGFDGADYNVSSFNVGNGWWRFAVTFTPTAAASTTLDLFPCLVGTSTVFAGDGSSGVLAWGAQLETGSFPTSYIPTSGSTVTRSADVVSMTGTNFSSWYTPLENTMLIDFSTTDISANSKPGLVIYDSTQGSSINTTVEGARAFYYVGTTNYIQVTTRTPQSVRRTFAGDSNYNALGQINKVAQAYAGSTDKGCRINGVDPSFTTSASVNPGNVDSMWIGRDENVSTWLNGYISRIACYSVRLSDTQLQALTL